CVALRRAATPPQCPPPARVGFQRLPQTGNRKNPPPRAENAANFFRRARRGSANTAVVSQAPAAAIELVCRTLRKNVGVFDSEIHSTRGYRRMNMRRITRDGYVSDDVLCRHSVTNVKGRLPAYPACFCSRGQVLKQIRHISKKAPESIADAK